MQARVSRGLGGVHAGHLSLQDPSLLMHEMTATPHQRCRRQLAYSATPNKRETWGPQTQGKGNRRQGLKRYFAQACIRKCGPSAASFTTFMEDCHPGKLLSPPQQEAEDFALEKLSGSEKQSLHKNIYFMHFNCYSEGIFSKHLWSVTQTLTWFPEGHASNEVPCTLCLPAVQYQQILALNKC